jgi:hypothetical protein
MYTYRHWAIVLSGLVWGGFMNALSADVPCWNVVEIDLTSKIAYDNPYKDVTITATFAGPQGQSIVREAFWYGQNLWKIRFAPTAPGRWTWKTVSSDVRDAGLHDQNGELQCIEYRGDNPVYRHGFLRLSANRRHFCHADGTPFFWLGDTHWQMPDTERMNECNHPEHGGAACPYGGQFQHLVADRKARGFNVYQTYPSATSDHWWSAKYTQIKPDRFREVFDVQMDHLARQGDVIALGCGHFKNSTVIPEADLCRWARYLVARYGAHPVVWITCQEMNAPEKDGKDNRIDVWQAVARDIATTDGYGHPHSAHQWVLDVATRPLGHEPWHDWFALQGGHRNSGLTPQTRYKGYYDFSPTRPMLETEAMYERVDCGGVNTTDEARQSAWKAMLCGSPGYTYGGAGIWALKWDAADPKWKTYNHAIGSWHEGMALPGSAQMKVLKQFFSAMHWTALTPRFQDPAWSEWRDGERNVLATISNQLYVVYCYGATSKGTLKQLDPSGAYVATWFDPRKGDYAGSSADVRSPNGAWDVPEKPSTKDWVLRLEKRPDTGQEKSAAAIIQTPEPSTGGDGKPAPQP